MTGRQTRIDSVMEVVCNTLIGLGVAQVSNLVVLPFVLGVPVSHGQALWIGAAFTVISVIRSYLLRRAFNGKSVWVGLKDACRRATVRK